MTVLVGATYSVYKKKRKLYIMFDNYRAISDLLLDFSLTVKAAPHECVIRTKAEKLKRRRGYIQK